MLRRTLLLLLACLSSCLVLLAQHTKTADVHGVATVYVSGDMTINEAEIKAVNEARRNALAEKYGTNVGAVTHDFIYSDDNGEHGRFQKHDVTELRGKWLNDTKAPKIEKGFDQSVGQMWVKAEVWGRASSLRNDEVDYEVQLLANGSTDNLATTSFTEGDRLRIAFRTPSAGYLAIYVLDKISQEALLLVPNSEECNGKPLQVKANKPYLFLDTDDSKMFMYCSQPQVEYDTFYVLYSPEAFSLPSNRDVETKKLTPEQIANLPKLKDSEYQWLEYVPESDFIRWIVARQNRDKRFQTKEINITIRKKN